MSIAQHVVAFGVYSAALIAIGAVGFTLQFGITNVLNLAFGAVMTSAIFVYHLVGGGRVAILSAIVVGGLWGASASWLLGRLLVQAYVRRGTTLFGMALVTIAAGLIVQFGLEAVQGPTTLSFDVARNRQYQLGRVVMSDQQLVIIASAVVVMTGVHLLLRHTRLGLAMRATADDPDLTRSCGISAERVRGVAWLVSGALCGICGVFLGLTTGSFNSTTSGSLFVTVVSAAVLGGIGKPYGAMVGALVVGMTSEFAAAVVSPAYKNVIAWSVLILILAVRPQGIFAQFATQRQMVR
jgi:branched-chain amino acid transport system permease protein/neutral amino acid transport system permease protein